MGERGRTCISCRRRLPKDELVRIVRRPDGTAALDSTGAASGRGAYVCERAECARRARRRLPGALRTQRVDGPAIERDVLATVGTKTDGETVRNGETVRGSSAT